MTDEHQCINFTECSGIIPTSLTMCRSCLDAARNRQRKFFKERRRPSLEDYSDYLDDHGYGIP